MNIVNHELVSDIVNAAIYL